MISAGSIISGSFDFVRRNLSLIAIWSVIYAAVGLLTSLLVRPLFDAQMEAITANPPRLPDGLFGYIMLIDLMLGILFLVMFAATFRAVLKPEASAAAYIRLGMDELRLLGLMIILFLGFWVALVAIIIALVLVAILLALVFGKVAAGIVTVIAYLGVFAAMIYVSVRLSTAAPLTILRGRITIVDAWKLTRGRFWSLFGGYLVIVLIVAIPIMILFAILLAGFYHQIFNAPYDPVAFQAAMRAQMESQAPGKPLWFVGLILGGLVGGFSIALQGAMTAIATRELIAEREAA